MIASNDLRCLIMCCVNEVFHLSVGDNPGTFQDQDLPLPLMEISLKTFSITCSGSSISKDGSMVAVGDFVGNVSLFLTQDHRMI